MIINTFFEQPYGRFWGKWTSTRLPYPRESSFRELCCSLYLPHGLTRRSFHSHLGTPVKLSSSRKGFTVLHHAPIIAFRLLSLRPRFRCAPLTWWCPYSQASMFIHRQTVSEYSCWKESSISRPQFARLGQIKKNPRIQQDWHCWKHEETYALTEQVVSSMCRTQK